MDFNTRTSQQYRPQPQTSRQPNSQNKQKKDEGDDPMRLSDKEIAGCISDIGIPFSLDDLRRPQPQQIQKVFEWFAELLMNTTRETVEPAMREAARDVCGDDLADLVPAETRNLMAFYASLRKLLLECGIADFSFVDLLKPTHPRLVRIFSYIINFVRFRESQTATIDVHFNRLEDTKTRIETLYLENQDMGSRLATLRGERKALEAQARDKARRNEELKQRLLELKKGQERSAVDMERAKGTKAALTAALQESTAHCLQLRQESERIRPYASRSSGALQAQLAELNDSLARDRARLEGLERRARALHTSADTFALAANDVAPCVSLLAALSADLGAEEAEGQEAARRKDALAERGNNVRAVEREEQLLLAQLKTWADRSEVVRKGADERAERARARTGELKEEHRYLVGERGERSREVERRKVRIEQTEKKMVDLKENIENEIHAAHDEYLKMDAHIKLYITEMEQAI